MSDVKARKPQRRHKKKPKKEQAMQRCSKAARAAFLLLHVEGLRLSLDGDRLAVRPTSRLTDELRDLIRAHRDELVQLTKEMDVGGFDPRRFPETVKILSEFRRVFGPGCRLRFAIEAEHTFGSPSPPGVPMPGNRLRQRAPNEP